uniref:Protondependent Oligopeptide Transporter (POT) Family putative n=1 Tax=Albugo laibachii Nc14 TaxID=890382 RepID=F0WHU0_9STRA|nr:Protondependent Oligopeptide Transporter (POT) Family putative [Albugo laibachii Nc14]|eukprot:CCA20815.1 Protondependent Oligopeptide Transporter (POT) Family putative [Albugo laibachii Nc14]
MTATERSNEEQTYLLTVDPPKKTKRSKSKIWSFCERLAYYGLTGSLPIFFHKQFGISNVLSTELNNAFTSLSYLTPLLGAYIADRHLGRFYTIILFSSVYLVGLLLCVYGAWPSESNAAIWIFMIGLFVGVAFGAGGIKPNVVVLGADQFDLKIASERKEKESFFNWFYWAINIGATFSYGILTNIAVNGLPPLVSQKYGFFLSFLLPTIIFGIALLVFYGGKSRYRRVAPSGSAIRKFGEILMQAGAKTKQGMLILSAGFAFIPGIILTTLSYFVSHPTSHLFLALVGAGSVIYGAIVFIVAGNCTKWLQVADVRNGGSFSSDQVNAVSQVLRLSPYLSFIIIFWAVYGQQGSNFVLQGCQMDLRFASTASSSTPLLSSAMLSILDSSVILAFIPIFDKIVYPFLHSVGMEPTLLRKIGAGLFCSILAMLMAAWIEYKRKQAGSIENIPSNCAASHEALPMSAISVWWQTPQYLLIGIGEILTSISAYDLFYSEVPPSMRSVCQALNLLTTSLGYIVGGGLNSIFSFWIPSDLNDGHLEYIFLVLAFIVLLNWIAFLFVSQSFESHQAPRTREKEDFVSGFSPALPRAARRLMAKMRPTRAEHTS